MFTFPSLLWFGLPLIGLPLLIHLINLMRHRRVKWAAMEFLLQSQRRQKRWILLKQLLLLLLRMAAIATVAFMIAQPILRDEWGEFLGGSETHHIVVLDDSYSMSDRGSHGSALDRAKKVVASLARQAHRRGGSQSFSFLLFSHAANPAASEKHDFVQRDVDRRFLSELDSRLASLDSSQTAATPGEALQAAKALPARSEEEGRIVYLVSDFRAAQWNEPTDLREAIDQLTETGTKLHLVHCTEQMHENLAITHLEPEIGTPAAGVELFMRLRVTNFGDSASRRVAVSLTENEKPRAGLIIDRIGPGESVTRRFRVNFSSAGQMTIAARLGMDAVLADNTCYAVLDIQEQVPVLLIDASERKQDSYFLKIAFSPGGKIVTGLQGQIETPAFLRHADELNKFSTIYLLDVPYLDRPEIETIEQFVAEGGGLGIFLGEESRGQFLTEALYRDGEGLLPVPVTLSTDLLPERLDRLADMEITEHPIFHSFLAMRNNPIDDVRIERYFAVPNTWKADESTNVRVVASLRNGAPLIVEKPFGKGRVVAVLTKISPEKTSLGVWNDWARNYSFLPTMIRLQGFLAAGRFPNEDRRVGRPLVVRFDAARYHSQVRFSLPGSSRPDETQEADETLVMDAEETSRGLRAEVAKTTRRGIYRADLHATDGTMEQRLYAYNVSGNREGDLHWIDVSQLKSRLPDVPLEIHRAAEMNFDSEEDIAGYNLSQPLLLALLVILLLEQCFAYFCSYHPPTKKVAS